MKKLIGISTIILATVFSCKKPYNPVAVAGNNSYLVVEGVVSGGVDSTIIQLSRTVKLSASNTINPELGATVTVESASGTSYPIAETGKGYYKAVGLNLDGSQQYRLKITTSNNKVYESDPVSVKNSPPIDSVNYRVNSKGVGIFVNTHDPANKTLYYRWSYVETYIIHAKYHSLVMLQTVPFDTVVLRPLSEQIYECWRNDSSLNVLLSSSAKLKQDVIYQSPLTSILTGDEKLANRYSILVTQYALTADAFNYWQNIQKNTEQLGSIFDAQPSEISGNIHCVSNPSEPVIGYMSVGNTSQTRIFIDNINLPPWIYDPVSDCMEMDYLFNSVDPLGRPIHPVQQYIYTGEVLPVEPIQPPGSPILGYVGTSRDCADCTLRGTNIQPPFWIDYQP